tara:strand:- start:14270 stop:14533 length:264 start_codon:yes stop_codon:yes gene_type:complete
MDKNRKRAQEVFARIGFEDKVVPLSVARDNSAVITTDECYLVGYEDQDGVECNEDGTYDDGCICYACGTDLGTDTFAVCPNCDAQLK